MLEYHFLRFFLLLCRLVFFLYVMWACVSVSQCVLSTSYFPLFAPLPMLGCCFCVITSFLFLENRTWKMMRIFIFYQWTLVYFIHFHIACYAMQRNSQRVRITSSHGIRSSSYFVSFEQVFTSARQQQTQPMHQWQAWTKTSSSFSFSWLHFVLFRLVWYVFFCFSPIHFATDFFVARRSLRTFSSSLRWSMWRWCAWTQFVSRSK